MALHCLTKRLENTSHEALLQQLQEGDAVLFLGAATMLALDEAATAALNDRGARLYALDSDVAAHGLPTAIDNVQIIDMVGWVDLTEEHETQSQWF